jgi:DNA repair protein RecN (Recombination protein N)
LREREQQRQRNIDILQYQIHEIEEANVGAQEEQQLMAKKTLLLNSERIHVLCESLLQLLLEKDDSFLTQLKEVEKNLSELQKYRNELHLYISKISDWKSDLNDLVQSIDGFRGSLDFEEGSLDLVRRY